MGRPNRSEQFSPDEVCIVHTNQRCVRRAFLAGMDEHSHKDFSYRREWIRRRLESLASVFGIDVLTYAVMSNHVHTILRSRPDVVARWSDQQVAVRWLSVFPGQRLEELHLAQPAEAQVQELTSARFKRCHPPFIDSRARMRIMPGWRRGRNEEEMKDGKTEP